ncbi:MAG: hypothetical protein ABSF22_09655 [Bryobacteraceae bacterium]
MKEADKLSRHAVAFAVALSALCGQGTPPQAAAGAGSNIIRADKVVLSPEALAAESEGYLPAFYANATTAETATPIEVIAGTEAHGIDLHLSRTRVAHVRGAIVGSSGVPVRAGSVMLWRLDAAGRSSMSPEVGRLSPNNGTFEFADVAPGSYLLGVNGSANGVDREDAWRPVQVGDSDIELKLALSKPLEIKGSVVVEGVSDQPTGLKVSLESTRLSGNSRSISSRESHSVLRIFLLTHTAWPSRARKVICTSNPFVSEVPIIRIQTSRLAKARAAS